jgi:hypothetical protein
MEEQEQAELAVDKSVTDIIEEMETAVNDLPDGPAADSRKHSEKWLDDQLGEYEGDVSDLDEPPAPRPDQVTTDAGSNVEAAADGGFDT